jgi:hypothetical protein
MMRRGTIVIRGAFILMRRGVNSSDWALRLGVTAVNGAPALFRPVIHASPSLRFRKAREQQLRNVLARRLEAARVERGWNMKSSIGDHDVVPAALPITGLCRGDRRQHDGEAEQKGGVFHGPSAGAD